MELVKGLFALAYIVYYVWVLLALVKSKNLNSEKKLNWLVGITFTGGLLGFWYLYKQNKPR